MHEDGEVDEGVTITSDGPLPGVGTRIGPWPHVAGKVVITADRALLRRARHRSRRVPGVDARVGAFLDALEPLDDDALRAQGAQLIHQMNTVVAWYADRDVVDALRVLLRDIAFDDLKKELASPSLHSLRERAWQLQRAAVEPRDDLYALAALQVAKVDPDEVKELLRELARDLSPQQRRRGFEKAVADVRVWATPAPRAAATKGRPGEAIAARSLARDLYLPPPLEKVAI